jgi:hypothetical protein
MGLKSFERGQFSRFGFSLIGRIPNDGATQRAKAGEFSVARFRNPVATEPGSEAFSRGPGALARSCQLLAQSCHVRRLNFSWSDNMEYRFASS